MGELLEICKKVKLLAYFGSYTRQEDFIEGISDINIFAITDNKEILLELGSLGYSPIIANEDTLRTLCEKGDPICYYLLYDSNIICGKFPENLVFKLTPFTCERLRKAIFTFLSLAISAYLRLDEISLSSNSFRAMRNLIQWKSCIKDSSIPIKISDLRNKCKELNMMICNEFSDVILSRKLRSSIPFIGLEKIVNNVFKELGINKTLKLSELLISVKDPMQVIINEDGSIMVK
ncbi:MAG: hypothetical protein QXE55_05080 [Saccharolobus sp.]